MVFTLVTLLLILQRYYFESESQHLGMYIGNPEGCCLSYKDTILKANHSEGVSDDITNRAVAYPTKILFWKRITASEIVIDSIYRCCLSYKDTILKANHSILWTLTLLIFAVAYPTKILFWKRITATLLGPRKVSMLLLILQRYYFESESQQRWLWMH